MGTGTLEAGFLFFFFFYPQAGGEGEECEESCVCGLPFLGRSWAPLEALCTVAHYLIFLKIILFIYLWLCWVFTAVRALLLWREGPLSSCRLWASHCGDFSCCM